MKSVNTICSVYCLTEQNQSIASVYRYKTYHYVKNVFKLHCFKVYCRWKLAIDIEWYTSTDYNEPIFWSEALNFIKSAHKWDGLIKLCLETMYLGQIEEELVSGDFGTSEAKRQDQTVGI